MNIAINSYLGGAGFALFTYILTFLIALFVAGIIHLLYRFLDKSRSKETKSGGEKE